MCGSPSEVIEPNDRHLDARVVVRPTDFLNIRPSPRTQAFRDLRLTASLIVLAHDQSASGSHDAVEQVAHENLALATGHVLQASAHEMETHRRLPAIRVRSPDPIPPLWVATSGKVRKTRRDLDTIRLHHKPSFPRPAVDGGHQEPVRTSDIKEGPRPVDRLHDQSPRLFPLLRRARVTGPHLLRRRGKIGRFNDRQNPGMPLNLSDLTTLQRLINRREDVVSTLLG